MTPGIGRPGPTPAQSGLRQWRVPIVLSIVCLLCGAVVLWQQQAIADLKTSLRSPAASADATKPSDVRTEARSAKDNPAAADRREIAELTKQVERLKTDIGESERMRAENEMLRQQLTSGSGSAESMEEARSKAKERAWRIQCVNNMKQLAVAALVWAGDNNDTFPPDVLSMTNEMNTPKILHCPADASRPMANTFAEYTAANCSYDYLASSASQTEPTRVMFRCPIHMNIGLCDGSVQTVGQQQMNRLIQRDGKLYFEP